MSGHRETIMAHNAAADAARIAVTKEMIDAGAKALAERNGSSRWEVEAPPRSRVAIAREAGDEAYKRWRGTDTSLDGMHYIAFHIVRALSTSPSIVAPVGVKPLPWREKLGFWEAQTDFIACYSIWNVDVGVWECSLLDGKFPTVEAAKAAAQADYERRILSALAAPVADSEPVSVPDGWQLVPKEPNAAMIAAGEDEITSGRHLVETYKDMLAAAPVLTPAEKAGVADGAQIEWLKARLADLQLPAGKRDHDTREKWLLQCGMPEADLSTTKPAQGDGAQEGTR